LNDFCRQPADQLFLVEASEWQFTA